MQYVYHVSLYTGIVRRPEAFMFASGEVTSEKPLTKNEACERLYKTIEGPCPKGRHGDARFMYLTTDEIPERLSEEELALGFEQLRDFYRDSMYKHDKHGTKHIITGITVLNIGGKAHWAFVHEILHTDFVFTTPVKEFLQNYTEL